MRRPIEMMLLAAGFAIATSPAFAVDRDLINEALNQNLQERDQVTGVYMENAAAGRPEVTGEQRNADSRIPVVIDGELASRSRNLRDHDRSDRLFRETSVEAHLDKEVKAVDREYIREAAPAVTNTHGG